MTPVKVDIKDYPNFQAFVEEIKEVAERARAFKEEAEKKVILLQEEKDNAWKKMFEIGQTYGLIPKGAKYDDVVLELKNEHKLEIRDWNHDTDCHVCAHMPPELKKLHKELKAEWEKQDRRGKIKLMPNPFTDGGEDAFPGDETVTFH